jgi:hypothetical protein
VFNINEVFTLPSQYILHRWTKYAKRGYASNNQESPQETLQTRAARISRKAASIALKCSVSEELLIELEKAIDVLDQEADDSLCQRRPVKPPTVHIDSNDFGEDIRNGNISFKVPQAIKGPMVKRTKDALEKKGTKKPKSGTAKPKTGTTKPKTGIRKGSSFFLLSITVALAVKFVLFTWFFIVGAGKKVKEATIIGEGPQQFIVRLL